MDSDASRRSRQTKARCRHANEKGNEHNPLCSTPECTSRRKGHICAHYSQLTPPQKDIHRVRVIVGGDRLEETGVTRTQISSITTTKYLINSTLSTPNTKFMLAYIKDYYYGTVLSTFEYIRISLKDVPDKIIGQYNLESMASDGWVYMQIEKGLPGLK